MKRGETDQGRSADTVWRRRQWGAVLVALSVVVVAACNKPVDTPVAAEALQDIKATDVMYGMTSYVMTAGVRQGRVDADTAYVYNDSSKIAIIGMHVIFYDDNGRERAAVTADSGHMSQRTQSMVAKGNVVLVVAADGRKIQSAELNYDPNRDRLWSDSATVQTTADGVVTKGSSFTSDLEFKHVSIRNIRGGGGIVF